MSENVNSNGVSLGMVVLIASIALNGLLAGYLIAKPAQINQPKFEGPQNPGGGGQDVGDARRIVGQLPPERRREILDTALKNLNVSADERPRALFQKRQLARRVAVELAMSDPLDRDALTRALKDVREINSRLAVQGDALILEVLHLMTPEERKQAAQNNVRKRRQNRDQRRPQRPPPRERD
jgi:uncharacterized membrane protein